MLIVTVDDEHVHSHGTKVDIFHMKMSAFSPYYACSLNVCKCFICYHNYYLHVIINFCYGVDMQAVHWR